MKSLIIFFISVMLSNALCAQDKHQKSLILMGSGFEITAYHNDTEVAWNAINAGIQEIERIEHLISSWDVDSQTSLINKSAGIQPVKVDQELYELIQRAIQISIVTDGAFDISYASMDRIWRFDGSMKTFPAHEKVAKAAQFINYRNIILNEVDSTVYLREQGMKIGFGALGKGYAAQRAKLKMQSLGIERGVVNASGDLFAWGGKGQPFGVVIADPKSKDNALCKLSLTDGAIVTSGNYEKYVLFNGKRYAHIIDPRTGYPTVGIKSVTIAADNPELADALSTTVFVLGVKDGLTLIGQLPGVECLIVDDQNQIHLSNGMKFEKEGI